MKKDAQEYLLLARKKAEEFGILPKEITAGAKPNSSWMSGFFSSSTRQEPGAADSTEAKKKATSVIRDLEELIKYFPDEKISQDIEAFQSLIGTNSESWQYADAARNALLKVRLLTGMSVNEDKGLEFDAHAAQKCLNSISKLIMGFDEEEAVAMISLAEKMIASPKNKHVAADDPILIAVKHAIDSAKVHFEAGREHDDYDLEVEESEDVIQLAIDEAKYVIETINNFHNPENMRDNGPKTLPGSTPLSGRVLINPASVMPAEVTSTEVTPAKLTSRPPITKTKPEYPKPPGLHENPKPPGLKEVSTNNSSDQPPPLPASHPAPTGVPPTTGVRYNVATGQEEPYLPIQQKSPAAVDGDSLTEPTRTPSPDAADPSELQDNNSGPSNRRGSANSDASSSGMPFPPPPPPSGGMHANDTLSDDAGSKSTSEFDEVGFPGDQTMDDEVGYLSLQPGEQLDTIIEADEGEEELTEEDNAPNTPVEEKQIADAVESSSKEELHEASSQSDETTQKYPLTPVPRGFFTDPINPQDDKNTLADVYLAMIKPVLLKLNISDEIVDAFKNKKDLENNLVLFIYRCGDYFSSNEPDKQQAEFLKESFDDTLKDIFLMINNNSVNSADQLRKEVKAEVSDELAKLAANSLNLKPPRALSKEDINGAIGLQSIKMAVEILNSSSEPVESGGGGYCGDRSIIQSMREAIRSGNINISEDHKLHDILQPTDAVGQEQTVAEDEAKEFRGLFVEYLISQKLRTDEIDTIADTNNVYWLTDQDMHYIAEWLKINLNVVQNVKSNDGKNERDSTYQYKPKLRDKSIGTINIFNQGYENQDGIHYQALLPKSRLEVKDDYVHVDNVLADEFDQAPSEPEADKKSIKQSGRLDPKQFGAVADVNQSLDNRTAAAERAKRLMQQQDAALSSSASSQPSVGLFSRLKNKVFGNENKSSGRIENSAAATNATTTIGAKKALGPNDTRKVLDSKLKHELDEALKELQESSEDQQQTEPLENSTPNQGLGLRQRLTASKSTRVPNSASSTKSASAPKTTSAHKQSAFAGFVGVAPKYLQPVIERERSTQDNESEAVTPTPPIAVTSPSNQAATPPTTQSSIPSVTNSEVQPQESSESASAQGVAFGIDAFPRPTPEKSLVAMVREILDTPNNNTGLIYNGDTISPTQMDLFTNDPVSSIHVATVTDRKNSDAPENLGSITATNASALATYDAMTASLRLIAAMPDAERASFIHPLTVRNVTTQGQIIGVTKALFTHSLNTVNDRSNVVSQVNALKDFHIKNSGSEAFKQALYEFLDKIPDNIYHDANLDGQYKDFVRRLCNMEPDLSLVNASAKHHVRPPRKQLEPKFHPLCGLLHNYTPPKSFLARAADNLKRPFTGDQNHPNPKNRGA